MTLSTSSVISQALVVKLRAATSLYSGLTGGVHEGFAPSKVPYPFLTYQLISAPISYVWGSMMYLAGYDLVIWDTDSVRAKNLDTLMLTALNDAALSVTGQSKVLCTRIADLSSQDVDEEGRKLYAVGGSYAVWTDQPR